MMGLIVPYQVEIDSMVDPYHELSWIFYQLVGQEMTTYVCRYVLYVLHFYMQINVVFHYV